MNIEVKNDNKPVYRIGAKTLIVAGLLAAILWFLFGLVVFAWLSIDCFQRL